MSNENPVIGLRPVTDQNGHLLTRSIKVSASNSVALGIGSPYYVSGGKALGLGDSAQSTDDIAGVIVLCKKVDGPTVQNIPATTDGYEVEVTYDAKQEYAICMDDDGFADDGSDNGKMYDINDETMTANSNGFDGDAFSKRTLDGSSEATSAKQFVVSRKTGQIRNVGGKAGTEVVCTINSANWQQW